MHEGDRGSFLVEWDLSLLKLLQLDLGRGEVVCVQRARNAKQKRLHDDVLIGGFDDDFLLHGATRADHL